MTTRNLVAAVIAIVVAAGCIRLGFWQLDRLEERRTNNRLVRQRIAAPPVPIRSLSGDPQSLRFRQVRIEGLWDFDREIVLSARSRDGSPGVHIVTPLRPSDGGPTVLVNRGWVYSPDAMTVDRSRWRESPQATVIGYVDEFAKQTAESPAFRDTTSRTWRFLYPDRIAQTFPEPVAPFYVVALSAAPLSESAPVRLSIPALNDGPHRSYALQWFSFAVIAIVGVAALIRTDTRSRVRLADGDG